MPETQQMLANQALGSTISQFINLILRAAVTTSVRTYTNPSSKP
jgi:hypothetical protein